MAHYSILSDKTRNIKWGFLDITRLIVSVIYGQYALRYVESLYPAPLAQKPYDLFVLFASKES